MKAPDATGRRRFVGRLQGVQGETATVIVDGRAVAFELSGMERARLVPDL
jgi:ribosome maturation factor RimP